MTSLTAWVGVDPRGPASVYFASDSRLSWPDSGKWDCGRKLFACRRHPLILGYCGDVVFPSQALSQATEMIDAGLLCNPTERPLECSSTILSFLSRAFESYPQSARQDFSVLCCVREGEYLPSKFHIWSLNFKRSGTSQVSELGLPTHSDTVAVLGSGADSVKRRLANWQKSEVRGTSRAVFSAFCDSLKSGGDARSGGPPQLTGLWRRGGGQRFGIVWGGKAYLYGMEVDQASDGDLHWYNDLFEVCDPRTLTRASTAQPQPRPRGL